MKFFKAHGKDFATNDNWTGLWASVNDTLDRKSEDAKVPGYYQALGTSQAYGESQVRREARSMVDYYLED